MASEFRAEKSATGYRVALYRDGEYYATFVDGLSNAAAQQEARSLSAFWRRLQSASHSGEGRGREQPPQS